MKDKKDKIQIVLACVIFLSSALLLLTHSNDRITEAKNISSSLPDQSLPQTKKDIQNLNDGKLRKAIAITETLGHYSEMRMMHTILQTFDDSVLRKKSPQEILKGMPYPFYRMKGAHLEKIISETPDCVSLKITNNNNSYLLDIFFSERTQKIKKIKTIKLG